MARQGSLLDFIRARAVMDGWGDTRAVLGSEALPAAARAAHGAPEIYF